MTGATKGRYYPSPAPSPDGETNEAYTIRLLDRERTPYDHERGRECSLGFHRTCSRCPRGGSCGCPCSAEQDFDGEMHSGAETMAKLYYLPDSTADRVMRLAAPIVEGTDDVEAARQTVREELSRAYGSEIDEWFAADVVNVLRQIWLGKSA